MSQTAMSQIPLTELDKEILDFWKLKNRGDYVAQFHSDILCQCEELKENSNAVEPKPLPIIPASALPCVMEENPSEQDSLSLDVTTDLPEDVDLELPIAAVPLAADSNSEDSNQSASTETLEAASPIIASFVEPVETDGSTVDSSLERKQIGEWTIIRKRSPPDEPYYLCKFWRNSELMETCGPFDTPEEAKNFIEDRLKK